MVKTGLERKEASKKDIKGKIILVSGDGQDNRRERNQQELRCEALKRSGEIRWETMERRGGESWADTPSQSNLLRSKFPFLLCSVLVVTRERE